MDIKRKKREFSSKSKVKVALKVITEQQTLSELSETRRLKSDKMGTWKKKFLNNITRGFDMESLRKDDAKSELVRRYQKIVQYKTGGDLLKKNCACSNGSVKSLFVIKKNTHRLFHRKAILASFFILLNFSILSAQNKNELRGQIKTENSSSSTVINVINLNTRKWTISQPNGEFRISAKEGDTVLFSSLQYQPKKISITNKILSENSIEVFLNVQVYELPEVYLNNKLSRDLSQVIKNLSYFNQAEVGFPLSHKELTVGERRLKTAQSGFLDPLLNALSGRTKTLKQQIKHEQDDEKFRDLKKALPVDYILSDLRIPEDSIIEFLYFCIEDEDIKAALRQSNSLEMMKLSEKKAHIFLNRMND